MAEAGNLSQADPVADILIIGDIMVAWLFSSILTGGRAGISFLTGTSLLKGATVLKGPITGASKTLYQWGRRNPKTAILGVGAAGYAAKQVAEGDDIIPEVPGPSDVAQAAIPKGGTLFDFSPELGLAPTLDLAPAFTFAPVLQYEKQTGQEVKASTGISAAQLVGAGLIATAAYVALGGKK